ncbi:MAG TPA: Crp/Fnr family transcriptional regulator [Usitatibacteraceae bacterium]|nr:Crp/Fnr family transcriptional regulator [Usitatibacteraceae bacterium]
MLNVIPLFCNLEPAQLASIGAHAALRVFEKGELIVKQGDIADSLYAIVSGQVKVFISNDQEREVIVSTLHAGEFFGEIPMFDQEPRTASVAALERCYIQQLSYKSLQKVMDRSPDIGKRLMQTMCQRLRHADRQISTLALMNISGRVSHALMELAIVSNGQKVFGKPFTQKDLAEMIGASREMVNRTLRALTEQGHIEVNRKSITILSDRLPDDY